MTRVLRSLALAMAMTAGATHLGASASAEDRQSAVTEPATEPALESVLGKDVATLREGDGGRVIDMLIDGHGSVRAAVVEFGGFLGIGTRKVAVDWAAFRFAGKSIWVDVTREQVRTAVEYKTAEPPFIIQSVSSDY